MSRLLTFSTETLCFICEKTGELKSSSNIIKFKMMAKLHLKTCDACKGRDAGKIMDYKGKAQKIQTTTRHRHRDNSTLEKTTEARKEAITKEYLY